MTLARSASFTAQPTSARQAREFVRATLEHPPGVASDILADVVLVVSELATNAVHHGAGENLTVEIERSERKVTLVVTSVLPPDADPAIWEQSKPESLGGRGIAIARAVSNELAFRTSGSLVSVLCIFWL